MINKSVLVLCGGDSSEREVSIRSGQAVYNSLIQKGYKAEKFDPINGVDKLKDIVKSYDVVLPILHGKNGEDGVVQIILENLGVKYLGTDSKHSANCFDKKITHEILESSGIRMPISTTVNKCNFQSCNLRNKPFVLKPLYGGSSLDTFIIRDVERIPYKKFEEVFNNYNEMLIEELIEGLEITVPILDDKALPVIAIIPPKGEEFNFENKYNGKTDEICPVPEDIFSKELQVEAQTLALNVHKLLNARHLSRVDIIFSTSGDLIVLELNTIPGLTEQSLFPKSAKVAGYDMTQLVDKFVKLAEGGK